MGDADEEATRLDARTTAAWVAGITLVLGLVLVISSASWIGARFGESHDGRNAAVWGEASRSIRTDGIVDSRFGGRTAERSYANHPPGIIAETALAELVGGEHRLATRAPAWIGSIAAIALLALLLLDAGIAPWAVASGMAVALTSAMFTVYGTMLDTPVTAVPFTLAVLVLVQRCAQGRRVPWWALALAGAGSALSGWASVFFTGAAGLWLLARAVRRRGGWAPVLALAGGGAVGLALTFSWIAWVYDGLANLRDDAGYRSSSASLATSLSHQLDALRDLVPLTGVVGVVGLLIAALDRRYRPLAAVTALPVVAYAIVFKGGADIHDYWNFSALLALALGASVLLQAVQGLLAERYGRAAMAPGIALASLVVLANLSTTSAAEASVRAALATPRLLDVAEAKAPAEGPVLAYLSAGGANSPWIRYESGRPGLPLDGRAGLEELAAREPDFPVLVILANPSPGVVEALRSAAYAVDGIWAVVPAADALDAYRSGD